MGASGAKALSEFLSGGEPSDLVFREMMEAIPVAIYTTDALGRLTYFNPAAAALSGRAPLLGTDQWCVTWKMFLADGTALPHDQCPMAVALRGGEIPNGMECIAERPDGSRFWFTPCPAVVRDAQGRITGGINLLLDITNRKNAELEATEQFRAIVEASPECVKIVGPEGTLLFMNPPGVAMLGAPNAEAVIGRSVYDFIAPEDTQRFREFNERVCRGEKGSMEFDILRPGGVRCRVASHAAPLRLADGTVLHLAITRDVTERRQAERAALLLGAIVDSSDDAIISKDLNGIITSWNASAARMFGYTAAEAVGRPVTILIPHERLEEEPKIIERLKRGERVDHFETVRVRKNGTMLDISLTISPVKDGLGNVVGASKIARDITERKQTEAALQASEARFRQLADAMPQIVWTAGPEGRPDYYNERWYQFTGLDHQASTAEWEPLIHAEDRERTREGWSEAIRGGTRYDLEFRLWDRRDRRWRWFLARALPLRGRFGAIEKWFGSFTDIDDQKLVEEDLRCANQDLEQFAFSASHDLQEPLRTIKIYSELLGQAGGGIAGEDGQEYLKFLVNGATRMEMLVRDLLSYTQVMRFERPTETADSGEALASTLESLAGVIAETGARVTAGPLPSVTVHAAHLQQLFQNLIGNAIKYRSPERQAAVHIMAERLNDFWLFSVTDNGIGIDPAYKESIFGLFKRLHTSDEYSGTGIGLAICLRIVDRYHGRIWVESEPGRGSTFRFTLPE